MGQTNIQVPIENRDPNAYVQENREFAVGEQRKTCPGPVQMGETPRSPASCLLMHGREQPAVQASDMRYGERMSRGFSQHMSGRENVDPDPPVATSSERLKLGGDHLPHGMDHYDHVTGTRHE
jgi:hypothetical protein